MYSTIKVEVKNGVVSEKEQNAYIEAEKAKHPDWIIEGLVITVINDDEVDLEWYYRTQKFQRIRRITGYLVGTIDRFNNAKRSEVNDRVKHSVSPVDDFEDVYLDA